MDVLKQFGQRIQSLRLAEGWSQEDLSDRTGLHRTYISGIERGSRNPTLIVIEKLARAFSKSPSQLMQLEDKIE